MNVYSPHAFEYPPETEAASFQSITVEEVALKTGAVTLPNTTVLIVVEEQGFVYVKTTLDVAIQFAESKIQYETVFLKF